MHPPDSFKRHIFITFPLKLSLNASWSPKIGNFQQFQARHPHYFPFISCLFQSVPQSEIVHRVILSWQFTPFKLLPTSSNSYRPVTFKFVAAARLIPYFSAIYSHETFRLPCSRFVPTVVSYPVVSHQARTIRIQSVESFCTVRNDSTDISIKYVFLVKYV